MEAKHDTAGKVINGRINGRFAPGASGNPGGSPDAVRRVVNKAFLQDMAIAWRKHGAKALDRVAKDHPAAFCKMFTLLVPREMKIEHSNPLKDLTDEQLEAMIEYIETSLAAQADRSVKLIEGTIERAAATAPAPKPKNRLMLGADTSIGPRERTPRKMRPLPGA